MSLEFLPLSQLLSAYSVTQIVLVAVVAVLAAVVGAIGGFGTGVLLTAVLVPILGIKTAIPVLGVAGIIINLGRCLFYFRLVHWPSVLRVFPAALVCLWIGVWLFSIIPAKPLAILVGLLILGFVPLRRYLKSRGRHFGPKSVVLGGGVFGVLTGFSTGAGVWLVSLLLGSGLSASAVVATDAIITVGIDIARTVAFNKLSLLNSTGLGLGVLIGLVTIPGSALGAWLVKRIASKRHTQIIEGLIVFGGLSLLWHGLLA